MYLDTATCKALREHVSVCVRAGASKASRALTHHRHHVSMCARAKAFKYIQFHARMNAQVTRAKVCDQTKGVDLLTWLEYFSPHGPDRPAASVAA